MAYYSPYQPSLDQREVKRVSFQALEILIGKTIVYTAQLLKFVIQFTINAIKSVLGVH